MCVCSCVDFCGGGFLVDGRLAEFVTSFVLFLDSENKVNEEDDEDNGEDETDCSSRNNSCETETDM